MIPDQNNFLKQNWLCLKYLFYYYLLQRGGGGTGGSDPLKNHKKLGFLSNTGPDPLKNHKATNPELNVGHSLACQGNTI